MAKKKAVKKIVPISVQGSSFSDMIGDLVNRAAAEKARFETMTPKQQKVYIAKKTKEEEEIQKILRAMGSGGPTRLQVGF